MTQEPDISVLMSVYNGERFLATAVQSILDQSFQNFQFIIINDGSTDGSGQILKKYAAEDKRIELVEQDNKGLISSLNTGLSLAKAGLIARMDADDIALSHRLEVQKAYMDTHRDVGVLGSAIIPIDDDGNTSPALLYPNTGKALDKYIYTRGSPLAHPAVMIRRDIVLAQGGYRSAFKHAEDYDLWLRLHKVTKIANIKEPLLKYRQHDDKVSVIHARAQAEASIVARYVAKEKLNLTNADARLDLRPIISTMTPDQYNLFEWDTLDVMASSLLMVPHQVTLDKYAEQVPAEIADISKASAVRVHLKFALVCLKNKLYARAAKYGLKAFCISPINTLTLMIKKITQ